MPACGRDVGTKIGITFAVRNDNGYAAAGHAVEQDGRRRLYFHHDETRFELFRLVARKVRPVCRPGNDLVQVAHHLAAVAYAEGKSVVALEEGFELVARPGIEQDGFRPALARAQHIAVGESAAGRHTLEIGKTHAPAMMSLMCTSTAHESGTVERGGHFHLAVDALLAQDGHFGAGHQHCGRNIFIGIVSERGVQACILRVQCAVVFLLGAGRIVAQHLQAVSRLRPYAAQGDGVFTVQLRLAARTAPLANVGDEEDHLNFRR